MKLLSRILAVAIAGTYGLFALPFLGVGLLAIASALLERATEHTAIPSQLLAAAIFVAIASILFAAALGLFKEKRWARWPFLAVALLASVAAIKAVPVATAILDHFRHPPEGAYVVLSKSDVASNFERFVFPSVWLSLYRCGSDLCVPSHAMRPNPSFERTANGMAHWPRGAEVHVAPRGQRAMPPSAAQLKR